MGVAHVWFLIGFRNRAAVALSWIWSYVTFQRGARLITGMSGARLPQMRPAPGQGAEPVEDAA